MSNCWQLSSRGDSICMLVSSPAAYQAFSQGDVLPLQVPILGELALSKRKDFNRGALLGIYAPFLLVPAGIAIRMASSSTPFGSGARRRGKSL